MNDFNLQDIDLTKVIDIDPSSEEEKNIKQDRDRFLKECKNFDFVFFLEFVSQTKMTEEQANITNNLYNNSRDIIYTSTNLLKICEKARESCDKKYNKYNRDNTETYYRFIYGYYEDMSFFCYALDSKYNKELGEYIFSVDDIYNELKIISEYKMEDIINEKLNNK